MNNMRESGTGNFAKQYNAYYISEELDYIIGLTNKGEEFWFDKEDYNLVKDYCWHYNPNGHVVSTERGGKKRVLLHRLVMGNIPDGYVVDHKFHPPRGEHKYDNRKQNLEVKTNRENTLNSHIHSNNTSGVSGVTRMKNGKWAARISSEPNKRIWLGSFDNFDDAVKARKNAEELYYGKYSFEACGN